MHKITIVERGNKLGARIQRQYNLKNPLLQILQMVERSPQQISLGTALEGNDPNLLSSPKFQDKQKGTDSQIFASPFRKSVGGGDESPKAEQSGDTKKYEQLHKICNQMRDKESELNLKQEKLASLGARKKELQRSLKELEDKSKTNKETPKNESIRQVEQLIQDKNTLIQVIENELTEFAVEQKTRVSSDEALVSGLIKKISNADSQISKSTKQATLALTKLTELQTKANETATTETSEFKAFEENIKKRRAELAAAQENHKKMKEQAQQKEAAENNHKKLEQEIKDLDSKIKKIKKNSEVNEKKKEIEDAKEKVKEQLTKKLKAIEGKSSKSSEKDPKLTHKLEELRKKYADIQKELEDLQSTEQEDSSTVSKNTQEIQRLKEDKKKEEAHHKSEENEENAKLKQLNKAVEALRKQEKKLKQEEADLQKNNYTKEYEDAKKKFEKQGGALDAVVELRQAKEKLENQIKEAKARYSQLEKEQKNQVPSSLIEEYQGKIKEKKNQIPLLGNLTKENVELKEKINEKLAEKQKIQWQKNPTIDNIELAIKTGKHEIDNYTQENKDLTKKNAQVSTKLTEYTNTYPDFQFPKKGIGKGNVEHKESKKEEPKSEKKAAPQKKSEPVVEPEPISPKKGKKKGKNAEPEPIQIPKEVKVKVNAPQIEKPESVEDKIEKVSKEQVKEERKEEEPSKKSPKKKKGKTATATATNKKTDEQTEEEFLNSLPQAPLPTPAKSNTRNVMMLVGAALLVGASYMTFNG